MQSSESSFETHKGRLSCSIGLRNQQMQKGNLSGFINTHSVAKYLKTRRGTPSDTLKYFGNSGTVPKQIKRSGPIDSSGFEGYVRIVQNYRGTLFY